MSPEEAILIVKTKKNSCKIVVNEYLDSYVQLQTKIKPEYYFIRNDAWVISCTHKHLKEVANLWKDSYLYVFKADNLNKPIKFKDLVY